MFKNKLVKDNHIYSSAYQGWYCVPDETFLRESQLKSIILPNGEKSLVSAESGHPVEWTKEQNYMFKLSNFRDDVLHWINSNGNADLIYFEVSLCLLFFNF